MASGRLILYWAAPGENALWGARLGLVICPACPKKLWGRFGGRDWRASPRPHSVPPINCIAKVDADRKGESVRAPFWRITVKFGDAARHRGSAKYALRGERCFWTHIGAPNKTMARFRA
jgi:hypothetical protein